MRRAAALQAANSSSRAWQHCGLSGLSGLGGLGGLGGMDGLGGLGGLCPARSTALRAAACPHAASGPGLGPRPRVLGDVSACWRAAACTCA